MRGVRSDEKGRALRLVFTVIVIVCVGLVLKSVINIAINKWYYGTNSYIDIERWRLMKGGIDDIKKW